MSFKFVVNCKVGVAYNFGNDKNPQKTSEYSRNKQNRTNIFFIRKRFFSLSSSEIHIFGYIDPFFMRFFAISYSSIGDS